MSCSWWWFHRRIEYEGRSVRTNLSDSYVRYRPVRSPCRSAGAGSRYHYGRASGIRARSIHLSKLSRLNGLSM